MIKKWVNFSEKSSSNIILDDIDFGITSYMLSNILLDITDEFDGIYIDYMSMSKFWSYLKGCSIDSDYLNRFESDMNEGNSKFVIVIDKPNELNSGKESVLFLEPKILDILNNIDGILSMYSLKVLSCDFFYSDTEYYIIIEKI